MLTGENSMFISILFSHFVPLELIFQAEGILEKYEQSITVFLGDTKPHAHVVYSLKSPLWLFIIIKYKNMKNINNGDEKMEKRFIIPREELFHLPSSLWLLCHHVTLLW